MADGSFDPLHHGHVAYLRAAASLGYPVLVNLCPDAETAKKHPVLVPAEQRAHVLDAMGCVAFVHVSERPTVDVLRALRPVAYVKGTDWIDRLPQAIGQVCDELQIRVRYLDSPKVSSTALLRQFQPDVDAFEQLVLSQTPAKTPWEPVTDYSFEARKEIEGKHPALICDSLIECEDADILDYGCGPAHLVRLLREESERRKWQLSVSGYDLHWPCDFGKEPKRAAVYDLVICREVLEHCTIREIPQIVKRLCAYAAGRVYVTTRFTHARHFLDFATSDDLDPTHISILPKNWLRHLFILEGFKSRPDLEERMDWMKKGRVIVMERCH